MWQCPEKTFTAIVTKAITGELPLWFDQRAWVEHWGGYLECHLFGVDVFSAEYIEHIHINSNFYSLKSDEKDLLEQQGIKITNGEESPYNIWIKDCSHQDLTKETLGLVFKKFKENDMLIGVNLNNSNIDDDKAGLIFAAVKANKDILVVKLLGNPINQDLLKKINDQLKENLSAKTKILFENFYQPERDFSYELPLTYQNSVLPVVYKLTTQRYQETLNIIQLQCRLPFNKAHKLFVATYNTWLNQTNLDSIRASSARKMADTILEKIYQFKEKPGFFCKKTFVLDDGEEIMLPKLLGEMLDFYIDQGCNKCDPEEFIEKCIDIAKKMPCNNKIQLLASVSALEIFCKMINQIQRPEQPNFTSFSLNCA